MKLIVGLGNPGERYAGTRHNLGFMALDQYAQKHLGPDHDFQTETKFKSDILKLNDQTWLVKPLTFMNHSGLAVKLILDYFKIGLEDVVVIYDELDLKLGQIKIRKGGSAAGHHGVESIVSSVGDDFLRLRLGIGNTRTFQGEKGGHHFNADEYVVEPFERSENTKVKHILKTAVEALDILLSEGLEKAQNQFH